MWKQLFYPGDASEVGKDKSKLRLESSTYLKSNVSCSEVICKHHDGGAVVGCELLAIGADVACNVLPCDGGQQRSSSLEGQVW
jgi:hypothetical protein